MEEGLNRFGEEVRVLRSKRILRTREDYVKAFGLNVDGCKVFPNPEEEGIYIKCPLSRGGWQIYKATLICENAFEGLYVFYPSWIDYHPYLEQWKAKNRHWKAMTPSEIQEAQRKARREVDSDCAYDGLKVLFVLNILIVSVVSPALIVTALLTGEWEFGFANAWLCALAGGVSLGTNDYGPRGSLIVGLIALAEMPISIGAIGVMVLWGLI